MLASSSKRLLYKALVIAGSASFEGGTRDSYWEVVSEFMMRSCMGMARLELCWSWLFCL